MKKNRRFTNPTNAVDPATTTAKNFGFVPVAGKGGKTTNAEMPDVFKRELAEYLLGGIANA